VANAGTYSTAAATWAASPCCWEKATEPCRRCLVRSLQLPRACGHPGSVYAFASNSGTAGLGGQRRTPGRQPFHRPRRFCILVTYARPTRSTNGFATAACTPATRPTNPARRAPSPSTSPPRSSSTIPTTPQSVRVEGIRQHLHRIMNPHHVFEQRWRLWRAAPQAWPLPADRRRSFSPSAAGGTGRRSGRLSTLYGGTTRSST